MALPPDAPSWRKTAGHMAKLSRIALRLVELSHAQLLEIAAAGCEASTEVRNRADAIIAAHKPLAQWAVEGVLLSSDLVPHLLAPLQLVDCAAAAVCSQWANGWTATSEGRRRLTQVAFDVPRDLLGNISLSMAVIPGGDEQQLVVSVGSTVRIFDRNMSTVRSFEYDGDINGSVPADSIAADEQFVYFTTGSEVRCLTHAGTKVRDRVLALDKAVVCPVLAPGGLLFCVLFDETDASQDEIVALDAQTLQLRYRFGLSMLNHVLRMEVVGEELFVCDNGNDRIQVFSLAGEHRRSITGEWKRPLALCFMKDRLYLVEQNDEEEDEEGELVNPLPGRRICVLSLQGDTLEVYTHPVEGHTFSDSLCCFDGKLLAAERRYGSQKYVGMVALRDL